LQKEKAELLESLDGLSQKFEKVTRDYRNLEDKHKHLQKSHEVECENGKKNDAVISQLKIRNSELEAALKAKGEVITRLEQGLSISEKNYILEKTKAADSELELMRSRQEIKAAADSIINLKKEAADKKAALQELTQQNTKLDRLVHNLDSTLSSYGMLEGELRTRILATEDYALQKEIQVQQL
jgi:chromosome segregation ATPase